MTMICGVVTPIYVYTYALAHTLSRVRARALSQEMASTIVRYAVVAGIQSTVGRVNVFGPFVR